jgi:hypothetical protein
MNTPRIPTTFEDLRARWATLHDLDRAESVKSIKKCGMSLRSLAKELVCCSDSHIRYLLAAAKAPMPDRMLARQGKISTRELVRRYDTAAKAEAEKTRASEEERRVKESRNWSTRICRWLQELNLAWAHQENVLEETRRELMLAELSGTLPKSDVPKGVALKTIIYRTRPSESGWEQALWIYFYITWLAHWTVFAIPDQIVRDTAIAEALVRTRQMEVIRPGRA